MSGPMDEFIEAVDQAIEAGTVRMVFWTCPADATHRLVNWRQVRKRGMVPSCVECGTEGEPR
jgi:hypothetical protein